MRRGPSYVLYPWFVRIMRVNCGPTTAYLAIVESGQVLRAGPERIDVPGGLEQEDRLEAVLDDAGRVLDEVGPDRVVILRPEASYKATHSQFTSRIALETLVRLAASRRGIPFDLASRPGVRAALDLPKTKALDSYLGTVFTQPVGGSWTTGRGLAAMAALASERT